MNIVKATERFEEFLAQHGKMVPEDLAIKHGRMAEGEFAFLRATFYRWSQLFPVICSELADAPRVLGVGDLHVENFGTWRDGDGRLVWGINDFDEACKLPYPADLVRLAVSAMLAVESSRLDMDPAGVCGAILDGYAQGISGEGDPFVLAERHHWLGALAAEALKEPAKFWNNLQGLPALRNRPPAGAIKGIEMMLPQRKLPYRLVRRVAGMGSLGKQRIVALAELHGSAIAREAKAITPSAWYWAANALTGKLFYEAILGRAVRCRDPWIRVKGRWLIRRLAPDCGRVELATLVKSVEANHLLHAMGRETANIHLGSLKAIEEIRRDLRRRKQVWLHASAKSMAEALREDWKLWRETGGLGK
ncbi:MAG: DUF2252 family protein [Tepidisphaeraceae bacterium]|jgi:hypothetical protein